MLLQFLTQNYASIRDEIILSLQPSADRHWVWQPFMAQMLQEKQQCTEE